MKHLARTVTYDELLAGLQAEVEAGYVAAVSDGPLRLFKYTDRCTFDRCWSLWSLIARGLIVDAEARFVVATPFPKFFNYGEGMAPGEPMAPLADEPFEVSEKVDGSLGIVFWHDGRWRVATRGSFRSGQARWAESRLAAVNTCGCRLQPGVTYLIEIVYRENRIVVSYAYEGLVLLAAYDVDGDELEAEQLDTIAIASGFIRPRVFRFAGVDELIVAARTLPATEEGFVVRFASGRRLKVKGDEYCRIHKLVSRVTPLAVWEMLVAGDDPLVMARQLPEEFRRDFEILWAMLDAKLSTLLVAVQAAHEATAHMADKDLGLWLNGQTAYPDDVARWIFPTRKRRFLETVRESGHDSRKRACETFRPKANILEGYEPSSAMNRFTVEA